jgi:hypothetical protein
MVMVRAAYWHPGGLLSVLTQWDGELWYIGIVRNGYTFSTNGPSSLPFFPFYPLLVKLVSFVFRDLRIAAILTSHACLIAAGFFLHALVRIDYKDPRVARAAVMFLMFSPVSFFFSNAYTESTFLMLATGSFLAARKGHWLVASLAGMCLAATRNVGLLITLPLFIEYVRQVWRPGVTARELFHPRVLLLALVPLGLGLYMLYGYLRFGDPLAFVHAAAIWGRKFTSPQVTLATVKNYNLFYGWLFLGTIGFSLLLWGVGLALKIRASYLVYMALLTSVYLCSGTLEAMPRYFSVEFPLFIVIGLIVARFERAYEPLLAASIALLTLCTVLSANGYWMT